MITRRLLLDCCYDGGGLVKARLGRAFDSRERDSAHNQTGQEVWLSGFRVAPKSCASSTLAFAIAANWPGSGTTATVDTLVRMRWPAAVLPWKRCVNTCVCVHACVWGRREGALVSGQN